MKYYLTINILTHNKKKSLELQSIPIDLRETNKYFIISEKSECNKSMSFFDKYYRFLDLRIPKKEKILNPLSRQ